MERRHALTPAGIQLHSKGNLKDPQMSGLFIAVLPTGKKCWRYRRRVMGCDTVVQLTLGTFPAHSIAAARDWAGKLNEQVEAGLDPRSVEKAAKERSDMTVSRAHEFYMAAVREGRRGAP